MGLAAVIIGETVFRRVGFINPTTMALLGSVLYKGAVAGALKPGLAPTDLKLITAIIVIAALSLNYKEIRFKTRKKSKAGGDVLASNSKFAQGVQ
jgi:putative ABC transport system permease protein